MFKVGDAIKWMCPLDNDIPMERLQLLERV